MDDDLKLIDVVMYVIPNEWKGMDTNIKTMVENANLTTGTSRCITKNATCCLMQFKCTGVRSRD